MFFVVSAPLYAADCVTTLVNEYQAGAWPATFSEWVRESRTTLDIGRDQFAELAGVTTKTILRIENSLSGMEQKPHPSTFKPLVSALAGTLSPAATKYFQQTSEEWRAFDSRVVSGEELPHISRHVDFQGMKFWFLFDPALNRYRLIYKFDESFSHEIYTGLILQEATASAPVLELVKVFSPLSRPVPKHRASWSELPGPSSELKGVAVIFKNADDQTEHLLVLTRNGFSFDLDRLRSVSFRRFPLP